MAYLQTSLYAKLIIGIANVPLTKSGKFVFFAGQDRQAANCDYFYYVTMEVCRNFCILSFIMVLNMAASSVDVKQKSSINKRHTPFLPGDYWKDKRPEFGDTETDVQVMVNATGRLKCPITHVADNSVSFFFHF